MKQFRFVALALGVTLGLAACGGGGGGGSTAANPTASAAAASSAAPPMSANAMHKTHNAMAKSVLNINMGQQNGSGQVGTASVADKGNGVVVTIKLNKEPKGASEPSHIHQGTCAKLNPAPWKPLKNVVNGVGVTTVPGVTVAQLKKGHYAINVHKSANDLATYVSCGDLTP